MSEQNLQDLRNRDLRERISRMVGIEPGSRYRDDHGAGMPKVAVVEVARELGVERVDDRDLEELYRGICDALGVERPSSSGNLWGLRREVLKEIVRELRSVDEPAKKLVADGGEEVGRGGNQSLDATEFPAVNKRSWAKLVRLTEAGDRVHIQWPTHEGDVKWASYWVQEAGEDLIEFGDKYRAEVSDDPSHQRHSFGPGGVQLLEQYGDEYVDEDFTRTLCGIERVPESAFDGTAWYEWEVGVSETQMGGVSTDQTLFPEAPTREAAKQKAKRWAGRESGYITVCYQGDEVVRDE